MPKKYEINYTLTFHVEAEDRTEASKMGAEALLDYLKNLWNNPYKGFHQEITEVKE